MPNLELENINFCYGKQMILSDINLSISNSELTVLLGPSGCGKSTMLNIISGLQTPKTGMIKKNNRDITITAPGERNIGYVFQNYALYPHMTVRENLSFPLIYGRGVKRSTAEIKRLVVSTAKMLDIADILERKSTNLSGGQQQRVAIGRAIIKEPEILLFDEPLSNLDKNLKQKLRQEIKSLHKKLNFTILYVTHDQEEAFYLADNIILMNKGKIIQKAKPGDLYNNPKNLFVAEFTSNYYNKILYSDMDASLVKNYTIDFSISNQVIFFRPEHVKISNPSPNENNNFLVSEVIDFGMHRLLVLTKNNLNINAIDKDNKFLTGDKCSLEIENLHLFSNGK